MLRQSGRASRLRALLQMFEHVQAEWSDFDALSRQSSDASKLMLKVWAALSGGSRKAMVLPTSSMLQPYLYSDLVAYLNAHCGPTLWLSYDAFGHHDLTDVVKVSPYAIMKKHITLNDQLLYVADCSDGGSLVSYYRPSAKSKVRFGQVTKIFCHRPNTDSIEETWTYVKPFLELSPEDKKLDPYRPRPGLRARCVYDLFEKSGDLVPISKLRGHAASSRLSFGAFGMAGHIRIMISIDRQFMY